MRPLLAHCYLGLGTLHSQVGRLEQARTELTTAMVLYRSMAMTFWGGGRAGAHGISTTARVSRHPPIGTSSPLVRQSSCCRHAFLSVLH